MDELKDLQDVLDQVADWGCEQEIREYRKAQRALVELDLEGDIEATYDPDEWAAMEEACKEDEMVETKEDRQVAEDAAAAKCYAYCKAHGIVCAGCNMQGNPNCGMLKDTSRFLFGKFLPAIDPAGLTFGVPAKEDGDA